MFTTIEVLAYTNFNQVCQLINYVLGNARVFFAIADEVPNFINKSKVQSDSSLSHQLVMSYLKQAFLSTFHDTVVNYISLSGSHNKESNSAGTNTEDQENSDVNKSFNAMITGLKCALRWSETAVSSNESFDVVCWLSCIDFLDIIRDGSNNEYTLWNCLVQILNYFFRKLGGRNRLNHSHNSWSYINSNDIDATVLLLNLIGGLLGNVSSQRYESDKQYLLCHAKVELFYTLNAVIDRLFDGKLLNWISEMSVSIHISNSLGFGSASNDYMVGSSVTVLGVDEAQLHSILSPTKRNPGQLSSLILSARSSPTLSFFGNNDALQVAFVDVVSTVLNNMLVSLVLDLVSSECRREL